VSTIEVGYVARAHGVHGELRVHLHDAASTVLHDVDVVWIAGAERQVMSTRPTAGAILLTVEGVGDREAADALRGKPVAVSRDDVPLAEGEFLLADLPGCEVVDEAGVVLGRVTEVMPGPQDLLVIRDDRVERLLPVIGEFVRAVDLTARRVVVALPEDLPEEPIRKGRAR
jgi:16S rRNA processing protein RimM